MARRHTAGMRLFTRNGNDFTDPFFPNRNDRYAAGAGQ
jgi:hypothetical protein